MTSIRIVLVSEHALTAMALRSLIESTPDLELAAHTSWDKAQPLIQSVQPDVVVVDAATAAADVAAFVQQLSSTGWTGAIVVLSAAVAHPAVVRGESAREVVVWVTKNGHADGVLTAIRRIAQPDHTDGGGCQL